jgi:hypothetical protein
MMIGKMICLFVLVFALLDDDQPLHYTLMGCKSPIEMIYDEGMKV